MCVARWLLLWALLQLALAPAGAVGGSAAGGACGAGSDNAVGDRCVKAYSYGEKSRTTPKPKKQYMVMYMSTQPTTAAAQQPSGRKHRPLTARLRTGSGQWRRQRPAGASSQRALGAAARAAPPHTYSGPASQPPLPASDADRRPLGSPGRLGYSRDFSSPRPPTVAVLQALLNVLQLKYISITDTKLTSLPRDLFRDIKHLKHLVVQKNPQLELLNSDVFRDAYKLEDVILDHNSISALDRDVFTLLTNIKRLNLGYNKIRNLPKGIFRENRKLEELMLSGNALHISSDTARDLLRTNTKLRVLLMSQCELDELPIGLLSNASNLEWLDVSHNSISAFPAELTRGCGRLAHLDLSYNRLAALSADVLLRHGGSLATLRLEGNPWRCSCGLLPLASWAALRSESVPARPSCGSPLSAEGAPLQRWLLSRGAAACGEATSSLRADLSRVLSAARAVATGGPHTANTVNTSDSEVSPTAATYFLHAMAAQSHSDVSSTVRHWARLLEELLDSRLSRYADAEAKTGTNYTVVDWSAVTVSEGDVRFSYDTRAGPLPAATTTPPAPQLPVRPEGVEALVNLSYIMRNVPENVITAVDDGIKEELKALFGVLTATNATGGATSAAATSYAILAPSLPNITASTMVPTNQVPGITSTPFILLQKISAVATSATPLPYSGMPGSALLNTPSLTNSTAPPHQNITAYASPSTQSALLAKVVSVVATSAGTSVSLNASRLIPANGLPRSTTLSDSTPTANHNVTSSTYPLPGFSANGTPGARNAVEVVAGLRAELRELLSVLLQSIDRANWDTAYQEYAQQEENNVTTSPQPPDALNPKETTSARRQTNNAAQTNVLIQTRLTLSVAFFTLLAHTFV